VSAASVITASAWGQAAPAPAGQAQGQPGAEGQAATQSQAGQAQPGQAPPGQGQTAQKEWKDRAEYDLYDSILKEQTPAKRLELLNQWRDKYANSNYAKERLLLYLDTYKNLNQAQPMYDTAKAIMALDPKDGNALYYLTVLTPVLPGAATNSDVQSTGEKAARGLIENLDVMRPKGTTDEQWKKGRAEAEAQAYRTLGWIGMVRKDNKGAQENFLKSLELNPGQGEVSYWLGNTVLGTKDLAQYPTGLYHVARAVAYDGPGALPAAGRQQVDGFLTKAYSGYHGDTTGLAELKAQAKTSAVPPADFKIASVKEVSEAKLKQEQEEAAKNPELALWKRVKEELNGPNGQQYFDSSMKDAAIPKLTGKVVSQTPKALQVAIEGDQPEITLQLTEGTLPQVPPGTTVTWDGAVGKAFTKEPFMVTMEVERSKISGLPSTRPAPAKHTAPAKRRR